MLFTLYWIVALIVFVAAFVYTLYSAGKNDDAADIPPGLAASLIVGIVWPLLPFIVGAMGIYGLGKKQRDRNDSAKEVK